MCTPTHQTFAQKFRWYAHFSSFSACFPKFQIFLEQSIFVVQKRLIYEKTTIFDEECNAAKIKRFS